MIPYFEQPHVWHIHAFGVMVVIAIAVGTHVLRKRAIHEGLDAELAQRLVWRVLVGGFAGAHLVHCLIYEPQVTMRDPVLLLMPWRGISSFGGFLGATIAALTFRLPPALRWRYLDAVAYAFAIGWIFGRAGCAIAYDHPGNETHWLLSWTFSDGVPRHNLGFYEMLYFIPLAGLFVLLGRTARRGGFFVGLLAVAYAPVRFGFDFLRTVDVRYAGLTPAQWACFAVIAAGCYLVARPLSTS